MTILRRETLAFGAALVVMVLLAGCARNTVAGVVGPTGSGNVRPSTTPSSAGEPANCVQPPTAGGPVPTPTGTPMITVSQGSNSWIANSRTEPYAIAVYADGTAIRAEANGAYSEVLPGMTIGRIDACTLAVAVDDLAELAAADVGNPQVTDQGTTAVTVAGTATGGSDLLISAYALGAGDEYVEPEQSAARERLSSTISALVDGLQDGRPWTPQTIRVTSLGEPLGNLADRPPALVWPLETGIAQTLTAGAPPAVCGELAGDDAAAVLQVLSGHPSATMWTDGLHKLVLAIGVLVPGQPACPAG